MRRKSLQPFAAEMIVAAFALDRLDDDRGDIDAAFPNELHDLRFRLFLARDDVALRALFRLTRSR